MSNSDKIILDLCGGTGAWSNPYYEAGYNVMIIDPKSKRDHAFRVTLEDFLYRLQEVETVPVHGVLAAPPCTHFANSGARWFSDKDTTGKTLHAIMTVRACLAIIKCVEPVWWCLENPVGRMKTLVPEVGPAHYSFDPSDFGDPWTKRTQLFGDFNFPQKKPVAAILGSMIEHYGSNDAEIRSVTSPGFAKAFFEVNP